MQYLQGKLDLFRFYKDLKYATEYKEMDSKTYCYSIAKHIKTIISDIYNKKIPVDLWKAYVNYE